MKQLSPELTPAVIGHTYSIIKELAGAFPAGGAFVKGRALGRRDGGGGRLRSFLFLFNLVLQLN